ncbi:hypothetical protein V6Z12_A06G035900 [Gossypium hirsutum]
MHATATATAAAADSILAFNFASSLHEYEQTRVLFIGERLHNL